MNTLKEFSILCACLFIGSILKYLIPLPIPETIYGMAILLLLFFARVLKPDDVRTTSNRILDNMAFLFLPVGVGVIENFDLLKANFVPLFLITIMTSLIALAVTMLVVSTSRKRRKDV